MYSLVVSRIDTDVWIVQLFHNRIALKWDYCKSTCKEHAEAEALVLFPQATQVNGIHV